MTAGLGSYVVNDITNDSAVAGIVETKITADEADLDLGVGITVHGQAFNGFVPGPTFRLNVGDTVIVRLINHMATPTGIHWHGIELENYSDGTPFTQNQSAPEHTFLYKFKVSRPGLYWYHPHHHSSTNQVFKGMFGMIIVADPNEATLIANGVLPNAANTKQIVFSDTTVCKGVGATDPTYVATYTDPTLLPANDRPEWLSGATAQTGATPQNLCELGLAPFPIDEEGINRGAFAAGDIPNIQRAAPGRTVEGQTVLTNGMNVGGRLGTPTNPGAVAAGAQKLDVLSGQGLRLQIVNACAIRYMRLILTTGAGARVNLVRVGGQGGLLDNSVIEGLGPPVPAGTFDPEYTSGEILIPPGGRADVVAAIPAGLPVGSVLTMWTRDYNRTGNGFSGTPTVPVMHLNVTGPKGGAAYTIHVPNPTPLRASIPGQAVVPLPAATGVLLDPAAFVPAKLGLSSQNIQLNAGGGGKIDSVVGAHDAPYPAPHLGSSRYCKLNDVLELSIENTTAAHHPFHLHGFSMQPKSLTKAGSPTFTWPYNEFVDEIDIPPGYKLTFRIRIDDRPLADGVTLGGALGRWIFHCHIFFHATHGMLGELVTTASNGNEKPNVNVAGSWAYVALNGIAERHGTFSDPDGDAVTLTAHLAGGAAFGNVVDTGGGTWKWTHDTTGLPAQKTYVYITGSTAGGRKDQAVFRLQISGIDEGADHGDPHITTVDGRHYDFQAVGEFTLLRDTEEGLEVQARQTPVPTANPVTDDYTGLTACVSINTAVAIRVGAQRIAVQPNSDNGRELQFFLDGKQRALPREGIDLGNDRVVAFPVGGVIAIRVDYANGAVVTVTPNFWNSNNVWYLNVDIAHTLAEEGVMGRFPKNSWLPALPNGQTLGPKPASLHKRYVTLYKTFADAWRVTDQTSLFTYAPGTSTATFTDADWPAEQPPCKLKKQFKIPGAKPPLANIPLETAKRICRPVTYADLNRGCVFDVATTGDKSLVKGYLVAQELRRNGTAVRIVSDRNETRQGEAVRFTATVVPLSRGRPTPTGSIVFLIDGVAVGSPVPLNDRGRAEYKTKILEGGVHKVRADYKPGGTNCTFLASSSPTLIHTHRNKGYPPLQKGGGIGGMHGMGGTHGGGTHGT